MYEKNFKRALTNYWVKEEIITSTYIKYCMMQLTQCLGIETEINKVRNKTIIE